MVQVYIEGFGSVEADNVATESTLQRIAGLLGSANNANSAQAQARLAGAANQAAAGLGTIQSATGNTNSALGGLGAQANVAGGKIAAFGKTASTGVSSMIKSLERSVTAGGDSMSAAFSFMKQGSETLGGVFKDIPILSGVASAAAGAFGMLLGVLQRTTNEFNNIQQSGAIFGGSRLELRKVANQSGLTLTQLNNVFKANGVAMSLFAGGTTEGAKAFTEISKIITKDMAGPFLRMGVKFEEMGQRTADYLEQQARLGIRVDESAHGYRQQAQTVLAITKQQKMMAAYNGTTLEQERQKQKQNNQNINLQAVLATQSKEQAVATKKAFDQIRTQYGDQAAKLFLEQQVYGTAVTKGSALFASMNQTAVAGMKNIQEGAQAGLDAKQLSDKAILFDERNRDAIGRELKGMAGLTQLAIAGANNDAIATASSSLLEAQKRFAKATNEVASKLEASSNALPDPKDGITPGMIDLQEGAQKFQNALTEATTAILGTSGVGGAVSALGALTKALGGGLQALVTGKPGSSKPVPDGKTIPGAINPSGTPGDPNRPMTQPLPSFSTAVDSVDGKSAVRVIPVGPNSRNIPGTPVSFNQTGDPGATPQVQQASFTPGDESPLPQEVQQIRDAAAGQSQQPNSKLNAELLAALSEIARNTKNTADQSKRSADSANDLARQGLTA